ncbi:exported hypothetical protein [Hyella patelloides LEGE 07179]|uniref:Uncharacterized protein n=1 Tax=Hyella patelloides LEGE 07179 TaxID=945734 RepID=A0A563W2A8_9CYAN|nr:hypothetical protein [Hyella patelloides]VEP17818.1 exported hypothetical protein [Hyella patelloides LEGE 07179]
MWFSKAIKKILGIGIFASSIFINLPVQAATWVTFIENEEYKYYIDLDGDTIDDNIWTVPLKATISGIDIAYGQLSINCQNRTFKLQLKDSSSNWEPWGEGDNEFPHQVCTTAFPDTYQKLQSNRN